MKRYDSLKRILEKRKCFKLVCGAGNEDPLQVKRLAAIFTVAGASILDISANLEIVSAAKEGIEEGYRLARILGKKVATRPYINVSVGLKGDPHVRKAKIEKSACNRCGKCITVCPQKAINTDYIVKEYLCIGCARCKTVCPRNAVSLFERRIDIKKILPDCVKAGVEIMELHASTLDEKDVFEDWKVLNNVIKYNFISMCLDRSILSDSQLIDRITKAYKITGERFIVQADGIPMSGENDDYNCTLQAVACADIVGKSRLPVKILLSGGTNSKTGLLSKQCAVMANGVAIGSFARKVVGELISNNEFEKSMPMIKKAVTVAEKLIKINIGAISG